MAYVSNETGESEVYIQSFPTPGNKLRISTNGGRHPRWRKDARELYYLSPDGKLMVAAMNSSPSGMEITDRSELFEAPRVNLGSSRLQYAVLDNGERFLFRAISESTTPRSITVLKNWKALIESR